MYIIFSSKFSLSSFLNGLHWQSHSSCPIFLLQKKREKKLKPQWKKHFEEGVHVTEFGANLWKYLGFSLNAVSREFYHSRSDLFTHDTTDYEIHFTGVDGATLVNPSQLPENTVLQLKQWNLIVVKIPVSRSVREVKPISLLDMSLYLGDGEEEESKSDYIYAGKDPVLSSSLFINPVELCFLMEGFNCVINHNW